MSKLRHSILAKYLISYSGIVFLCCAAIGFFILYTFVNLRTDAYNKTAQEKMSSVLTDMETQFESLEDIALDISTSSEFNFRLFSRNKFYEIELLEVFAKYKNYSPLTNEYFLIYHQYPDLIYKADDSNEVGNSAAYSHFIKSRLKAEKTELLKSRILNNEDICIIDLSEYGGKNKDILICYTVYTSAVKDELCKASLCFIVEREQIEERILTVSGGFGERVALYYGDILLTDLRNKPLEGEEVIEHKSLDTPLVIIADIDSDPLFQLIMGYQKVTLIFFFVSLLLFLLLAVYIAYKNYKPIHSFVSKYGQVSQNYFSETNEFENIEHFLLEAKSSVEAADQKSIKQIGLLKSQILLLLLGGIVSKEVIKNLELLRDGLKGPFYKVLCVEINEIDESELTYLKNEIESFSNIDTTVYTCNWRRNDRIYVILSMKDDEAGSYINDLIEEICEAKNLSYLIGESTSKSGIESIHNSCLQAINSLNLSKNELDDTALAHNMEIAGKEMALIVEYINRHYLEWDLSLEKIAEIFSINATCLSSTFKIETGVNYKSYLIGLRIKEAKRLLRETEIPITEICNAVGYSSLSYFIIKFKEIVGETPNSYRKKIANFKIM